MNAAIAELQAAKAALAEAGVLAKAAKENAKAAKLAEEVAQRRYYDAVIALEAAA